MKYPQIQDYDRVMKSPDRFLFDQYLQKGKTAKTKSGSILGFSGGFSRAYPLWCNGKKLGIRCWTKNPGECKKRYEQIKNHQSNYPSPYLINCNYFEKGISVNNEVYPILSMDWVNGISLDNFLDKYISIPKVTILLAEEFLNIVKDLHQKKYVHGDIQHGNIIIDFPIHPVKMTLIDYDSMIVPGVESSKSTVVGVESYQHPLRSKNVIRHEKMDYFSEIVIYISLLVYAEQPDLWKKGQDHGLLFTEDDFINPNSDKSVFQNLKHLPRKIRYLLDILKQYCLHENPNDFEPLEQILKCKNTSKIITTIPSPPEAPVKLDNNWCSIIQAFSEKKRHAEDNESWNELNLSLFGNSIAPNSTYNYSHVDPFPKKVSPITPTYVSQDNFISKLIRRLRIYFNLYP